MAATPLDAVRFVAFPLQREIATIAIDGGGLGYLATDDLTLEAGRQPERDAVVAVATVDTDPLGVILTLGAIADRGVFTEEPLVYGHTGFAARGRITSGSGTGASLDVTYRNLARAATEISQVFSIQTGSTVYWGIQQLAIGACTVALETSLDGVNWVEAAVEGELVSIAVGRMLAATPVEAPFYRFNMTLATTAEVHVAGVEV